MKATCSRCGETIDRRPVDVEEFDRIADAFGTDPEHVEEVAFLFAPVCPRCEARLELVTGPVFLPLDEYLARHDEEDE